MNNWINLAAVSKILIFGLLVGASVPTLFALGVRLRLAGQGAHGPADAAGRRVLTWLSWISFALVVVVVLAGVLFIANNFIGHHTGLYLFGSSTHPD